MTLTCSTLDGCDALLWRIVKRLTYTAVLLSICLWMLHFNLQMLQASLQTLAAAKAVQVAASTLAEAVDATASSAEMMRSAAESTLLHSSVPPLGGFSHLVLNAVNLMVQYSARPPLQFSLT